MMRLSDLSMLVGAVYLVLHGPLVLGPGLVRKRLAAFPRNRWAGAILAVVALAWSAWAVKDMPMGFADAYKSWLPLVALVVYGLVVALMAELLAVRALGGLLMLAASPVLEAQRLHPSCWTWVLAFLAYVWVVVGIALVLSPYRFRHAVERYLATDGACRLAGVAGLGVGALLIGLGLSVFR